MKKIYRIKWEDTRSGASGLTVLPWSFRESAEAHMKQLNRKRRNKALRYSVVEEARQN